MKGDIQNYVQQCDVCQRSKSDTLTPAGLLELLTIPDRVWEDVLMNFIKGLPTSNGFSVLLVVVDRLSKYGHFIALLHPYSAKTVVEAFVKEVVWLHDMPQSIVSDRDPIFTSQFWVEYFRLQGSTLRMSSTSTCRLTNRRRFSTTAWRHFTLLQKCQANTMAAVASLGQVLV